VNKCLAGLSRRAADDAVAQGRVTINGATAQCGAQVQAGDRVRLDGRLQAWEGTEMAKRVAPARREEQRTFLYIKYWKPVGVSSTTDRSDPSNLISRGGFNHFPQRVFPVGRLDKDSSGLILLTSDGRLSGVLLGPQCRQGKVSDP
jgi:23S rRNA pseudouridine2604 synthase